MFKVFADKNAFEHVVMCSKELPHLNKILSNHAQVCLNITDDELLVEEATETPIFLFIQSNGGKSPIALKPYFDAIYDDPSNIVTESRSMFLLDISEDVANDWQERYGLMVQSKNAINENAFKGTAHKELPKNTKVMNGKRIGWSELFNFSLPPSNSMVITDDYLLNNEENGTLVGEPNLIEIANALLPAKLDSEYHILILTDDKGRTEQRCYQLAETLMAAISALRPYTIKIEIVFTDTIHKRKIFLNYMTVTCDKGFAMFRVADRMTVRDDNDFRYEMVFHRVNPNEGDTVFKSDSILLKQLQAKCNTVTEFVNNTGQIANRRVFGDTNANRSMRNRLINDV